MRLKKQDKFVLFIILLFILNYSWIDSYLIKEFSNENIRDRIFVKRIIDGDTIESSLGKIRLLGINTPERGEVGYEEAKEYLQKLILNKSISIEYGAEEKDKYNRTLGHLFLEGEHINLELVRKGYANYYFPKGKEKYYFDFVNAWNDCIALGINLCEKSNIFCGECISLEEFDIAEERIILKNNCDVACDLTNWTIKDEGRKKLYLNFTISGLGKEVIEFENVWTKTGDTLFLRDKENKLVLYNAY